VGSVLSFEGLGRWMALQLRVREVSSSSPVQARRTCIVSENPRLPSDSLYTNTRTEPPLHSTRTTCKPDNVNHAPRMQSVGSMPLGRQINRTLFVRHWKCNFGSFHTQCLSQMYVNVHGSYVFVWQS